MSRPDCIKNWREIQLPDEGSYPGSQELFGLTSSFSPVFGLTRLGIHHEVLPPGRRTSWPHAEKTEEEFVFVIEGTPDVWLDGVLHRLAPGDAVGFPAGTGVCHVLINNSQSDVRLMVIGERTKPDNQIHYALHPQRNAEIGERHWHDVPLQPQGDHDGLPDQLRESNGPF
ncbi:MULTISPECIES: cupin domain-containing protein [Silvimonas]|uniref:cupin domain-containing protein n=1 Tax=Silvimonas TaxID=300264 RepID=UPI0024B39846|nr:MULTISPECIES: cupin domain-containing protein [Silvimonas]MDR3426610.1 cupin domain-containing protein [Silvimonas sp.]